MSVLSQPVRQWGVSRLSALRSAVSRALSALPAADSLRSVPTPRAAFRCESALLTVVGVLHVLAPLFVLRASFAGSGSGREKEVAAGCADERSEELVGALLVALIQAAGSAFEQPSHCDLLCAAYWPVMDRSSRAIAAAPHCSSRPARLSALSAVSLRAEGCIC